MPPSSGFDTSIIENQDDLPTSAKAARMDYFSILHLSKEPFSNSPDPDFFFHSRQHRDCLQKLELSLLLRRGLNVIIGDVGTGKTTMCRQLIRRFSQREEMETYLILDPHFLYAAEFLATVAQLLTGKKLRPGSPDWQIKEYIKQHLFRKGVEQGKTIVLIIDEGQKIPAFVLEMLREFLNYETNAYKLLQIVIFAQREFEKKIRKYPNFADRISLYHLLKPLSFHDTRRMIKFRLEKSSSSPQKLNLFTYPALWAIFRITGGYPRKIINLCHQTVLSMIIQNRSRSGYFLVTTCARRVFPEQSRRRNKILAAALISVTAACIVLILMPIERIKTLPFLELTESKAEFPQKPSEEVSAPDPKDEPMTLQARISPGGVSFPDRFEDDPVPSGPENFEEPEKSTGNTDQAPAAARADTPSRIDAEPRLDVELRLDAEPRVDAELRLDSEPRETQPELSPPPTYAEILGRITLERRETLSRIIRQVYGGFNSSYMESFIGANPGIKDPDRVEIGQIIALPAVPVKVTPGDRRVRWIKFDETDTLEDAFKILRNHPDGLPPLRLIPYWNPAKGTKFALVVDKVFKDELSARDQKEQLPAVLTTRLKISSLWDSSTVYFANPYFDRAQ